MKVLYGTAVFLISTLFLLSPLKTTVLTQELKRQDETRAKAEKLWEQAIVAKGGRERLHAVHNFAVSSKTRFHDDPRDVMPSRQLEAFYVLPSMAWSWDDYRPGKLGLWIETFNLERNKGWELRDSMPAAREFCDYTQMPRGFPVPTAEQAERMCRENFDRHRKGIRWMQLLYFMETKWVRPKPIGARTETIGFLKKVDVVETVVDHGRIDFYLDPKTHLPIWVVMVGTGAGERAEHERKRGIKLSEYAEVNGIQMPGKVNFGGDTNRTTYQININHEEMLFNLPPTVEAGPLAWRAKS